MQGHFFDGSPMPWVPSPDTIECAGGLYTTAERHAEMDGLASRPRRRGERRMARDEPCRLALARRPVAGRRASTTAAPMGAMSLGWVVVLPEGNAPLMLNKSGGLQGEFSYVVIAPTRGVGVFASINEFSVGGFAVMVQTANALVAELAPR